MKKDPAAAAAPEPGGFHDTLVAAAWLLFDAGPEERGRGCAVVAMCGTACDAAAAQALRILLERDGQRAHPRLATGKTRRLRELLRSNKVGNLKPKSQRDLWQTLTEDRLSVWPDWIRYVRCVEHRNTILHAGRLPSGRLPSRADALTVTQSFITHLDAIIRREAPLRRVA